MHEDAHLEMEFEDRFSTDWEPDDLEMFNQAEADDYRHEFDDFDGDDFYEEAGMDFVEDFFGAEDLGWDGGFED